MSRTCLLFLLVVIPVQAWGEALVAARVVRPNAVIVPDDIAIIENSIPGALSAKDDVVGLEARITLYPGRPILAAHVGPAAIIQRNQPITLVYQHGGLSIETEARALSRGAAGDVVRVMNLASRATVSGTVLSDGTVIVNAQRDMR